MAEAMLGAEEARAEKRPRVGLGGNGAQRLGDCGGFRPRRSPIRYAVSSGVLKAGP